MQEPADIELLRRYADENCEESFATLVTRYVNMVYSAALRKTGNAHAAEEITQAVFVILAKKARNLRKGTVLSGWLYQSARLTASNFLRGEIRRTHREQEAFMQSLSNETAPELWHQIAPMLEDAMGKLGEKERNAVALRFFEGKSFSEIAGVVGATENAAKKRVAHALEKLRRYFSRRGVDSTAETISETISTHSVHAAPVLLAKTVTAVALAKGATASLSTLTLIKGAMKLMAWTKTKTTVVIGVAALLTIGTTTLTVKTIHWLAPKPDIRGAWEGVVPVGGYVKLRVVLNLTKQGSAYQAAIDSIDQRVKAIPVENLSYDYPSISFDVPSVNGTYKGKFNSTNEMTGTWKQMSLTTQLKLKHTAAPLTVPDLLTETDYAPRTGSDLQGYWKGTLKAGRTPLQLVFKISEPEDAKYVAELDSIDQNASGIVISAVTYNKPDVQMDVGELGGGFSGTVSSDDTQIAGKWTQNGKSYPLTIQRSDPAIEREAAAAKEVGKDYSNAGPNDLTGHWLGTLENKGIKLRLALHVAKMSDGTLSGTLDSLDQGAKGIPATTVTFTAPDAHLEWKKINGTFDGKVENDKITGTWMQMGKSMPLVFERSTTP